MKWIWPARSCLRGVRNTNFGDLIDECHEIVMQLQGFFSLRARSKENLLSNSFPGCVGWVGGLEALIFHELGVEMVCVGWVGGLEDLMFHELGASDWWV